MEQNDDGSCFSNSTVYSDGSEGGALHEGIVSNLLPSYLLFSPAKLTSAFSEKCNSFADFQTCPRESAAEGEIPVSMEFYLRRILHADAFPFVGFGSRGAIGAILLGWVPVLLLLVKPLR